MLIYAYDYLLRLDAPSRIAEIVRVFNRVAREVCEGQQMDMDFETRLSIQYRILEACEYDWQHAGGEFVTDRTPVDFLAYTLGDVQGKTAVNQANFDQYLERCFELTNRFFGLLVILQPGIPLEAAEGKAALNHAYIEHINSLVIGLGNDERVRCEVLAISRNATELTERIRIVSEVVSQFD